MQDCVLQNEIYLVECTGTRSKRAIFKINMAFYNQEKLTRFIRSTRWELL